MIVKRETEGMRRMKTIFKKNILAKYLPPIVVGKVNDDFHFNMDKKEESTG
jgi:hypothetical protein